MAVLKISDHHGIASKQVVIYKFFALENFLLK